MDPVVSCVSEPPIYFNAILNVIQVVALAYVGRLAHKNGHQTPQEAV